MALTPSELGRSEGAPLWEAEQGPAHSKHLRNAGDSSSKFRFPHGAGPDPQVSPECLSFPPDYSKLLKSHVPLELLVSETPAAGLSPSLSGDRLLFSPKQVLLVLMGSVWPGLLHLSLQAARSASRKGLA